MNKKIDAYGGVARYYDACVEPILGSTRSRVARLCHELGARRVVDICCGTGKQMEKFYELGMDAYGVDMSHGMLEVARMTAQKAIHSQGQGQGQKQTPKFTVLHADATRMPFVDASFDIATVSLALHEMPLAHAQALVLEALRVAKSLLILDYCMAERNIEVPATSLAFVVERLVGGEHYQNYKKFMHQGAVEGLITRLGLSRIMRQKVWAGAGVMEVVQR